MTGLRHDPRWSPENVLAQIKLGEESEVEFKQARLDDYRVSAPQAEKVADVLAAFANAHGGTLILSVSDPEEIRTLDRKQMDALEEFISNICEDRINPPLSFFTRRFLLADRRSVLLVTVAECRRAQEPGGFPDAQGHHRTRAVFTGRATDVPGPCSIWPARA